MNNKYDIKLYDILYGLTEASKNFGETDKNVHTGLEIEKALKEIREYLEEYPGCVKIRDKRSKISKYLNFYKEEIKRMSNENSDAKYICDHFNWNLSVEDMLKKIREYLEEHLEIAYYSEVSDGLQITHGNVEDHLYLNKAKIKVLSDKNNDAKYICEHFKWVAKDEDRLKEIREYLKEHPGITDYSRISDRLQMTGIKIGNYLFCNKEKIKDMSNENSDAKYICDYFKWNITIEDILKEIREYSGEHLEITNYQRISYILQTTGNKMGYYLYHNKEKIKEMSNENDDAKYICRYFGWIAYSDSECNPLDYEHVWIRYRL